MNRRRIAAEWASTPIQCPFHACMTAICHAPEVDTSPEIYRYHAYGIVQGRLLHAYAKPMIFNWDVLGTLIVLVKEMFECIIQSRLQCTALW